MKAQLKRHDLETVSSQSSIYRYRCRICQQEWKRRPGALCPGVKVFFSRNPKDCPEKYKTLVELDIKGLQPKNASQPIAAFKSSRRSHLVLLYDETDAISSNKKRISTVMYIWCYHIARLWRRGLGIVVSGIIATLIGFSVWSRSAPLVVFMTQNSAGALIIGSIVLFFTIISLIFVFLPEPNQKVKWKMHGWIFSVIVPAVSNTLFLLLLGIVLIRPPWCQAASIICPAPQHLLILHSQNSHDQNLEMYPIAVQSTYYVIPGDPARYTLENLPTNIGALRTDVKGSLSLYHIVFGLDSLQRGPFGLTIREVNLIIQQVEPISHPLDVWNKASSFQYESKNLYRAFYSGLQEKAISTIYLRYPDRLGYMHLNPQESDQMDIYLVSNTEVDIKFSVEVIYRVDSEPQYRSLQSLQEFEVMFADQSDWQLYHLQYGRFVPSS